MRPRRGAAAGGCASPWGDGDGGGAARCRGAERGLGLSPGPPAAPRSSGPRCPPHGRAVPAARGARCESRLPGDVRNVTVTHGRGAAGTWGGGPAAPSPGGAAGGRGGRVPLACEAVPALTAARKPRAAAARRLWGASCSARGGGAGGGEAEGGRRLCATGGTAPTAPASPIPAARRDGRHRGVRVGTRVAVSSARGYGGRGGGAAGMCHPGGGRGGVLVGPWGGVGSATGDAGPNRNRASWESRAARGSCGRGRAGQGRPGGVGGPAAPVPPRSRGGVGGGSGDTQTRRAAAPPLRVTSGAAIARQEAPRVRGCGAANGTPRCHGNGAAPGGLRAPRRGGAEPEVRPGRGPRVCPSVRPLPWAAPGLGGGRGAGLGRSVRGWNAAPDSRKLRAPSSSAGGTGGKGAGGRGGGGAEHGAGRSGPPRSGAAAHAGSAAPSAASRPPTAVPLRGAPGGPRSAPSWDRRAAAPGGRWPCRVPALRWGGGGGGRQRVE